MYVYILKSNNKNWFYVGLTNNLIRRLKQHNTGKVLSTKYNRPYGLIYKKKFLNKESAIDFEKFLKIRCNKEKLLKELNYI